MAGPTSRHLTVPCARCGRAAAELSLLPEAIKSRELFMGGDRLERTEFLEKHVVRYGHIERLVDLFEAIRVGDYHTARDIDPDFVSFICEVCERPYCDTCWIVETAGDSYYEPTVGSCPLGHRQTLEG